MDTKYRYFKSEFTGQVYRVTENELLKYKGYKEISEEEFKKFWAEPIGIGQHIYHDLEFK